MKKRMLAWLLVLVMALGMVPVPAMAQEYAPTDGTAIDRVYQMEGDTEPPGPIDGALTPFSLTPAEPAQADGVYQIGSKEELAWLAQEVNAGRGKMYSAVLTGDINLENEAWTPIGKSSSYPFSGSFDGQGYTISGLNVTASTSGDYGLFGYGQECTIQNVTVEGQVQISGSGNSSYGIAGILGRFYGTSGGVENCINRANVSGGQNVGGIVGYVFGGYSTASKYIRNCANLGAVAASGNNTGGIAGYVYGQAALENCYNTGSVSGGGWRSGGTVAYLNSSYATVQNCYTIGTVTHTGSYSAPDANPVFGKKQYGSAENIYYLDTLGTDSNATAKTEAEMQSSDFAALLGEGWLSVPTENNGYPILAFQIPRYEVGFTVTPAEAQVSIEGAKGSQDGQGNWTFQLPEGTYRYTVSAFGYETAAGGLEVTGGGAQKTVSLTEVSKKTVRFRLTPADAILTVSWQGQTISPEGDKSYSLPYGEYHYLAKAKGCAKQEADFTVSVASPGEISIILEETSQWDGETIDPVTPNSEGVYEIGSGSELAWLAQEVNAGQGKTYSAVLTNDIDLGGHPWTPIGNSSQKFQGRFDGQGHTVSGLNVSGAEYAGLFGYVQGSFTGQAVIQNVVVQGSVSGTSDAGGIAGRADKASFANCGSEAAVQATGSGNAGGIVGRQHTYGSPITITGCYNAGPVSGSRAGGIIGFINEGADISSCYNTGEITGSTYGGGIRGQSGSVIGSISGCYNAGTVTGSYSGPIQPNATVPEGNYFLGDGGLTMVQMTTELLELLNGGTGAGLWKQVPGFRDNLPVLAWEKAESQSGPGGETVLAPNAQFARDGEGGVTSLAQWEAVDGATSYTVTIWENCYDWQTLSGEELDEYNRCTSSIDRLKLIDETKILDGLSSADLAEYYELLAATVVLEGEDEPVLPDEMAVRQRALADFLIGHVTGADQLGYYVPRLERRFALNDVQGTRCELGDTLSALGEGLYYFTAVPSDTPEPSQEAAAAQVRGYQDVYGRLLPVTGLTWDGTYACWSPKASFAQDCIYTVYLYRVDGSGTPIPESVTVTAVPGNYTRVNCANGFVAGGRYVFAVSAEVSDRLTHRGFSDSPVSQLSGVYTVQDADLPGGETNRVDWVPISTPEEWMELANVQDVSTDPNDSSTNLQTIAWGKKYYLTADLDFSTLSAASQTQTKSIGNLNHPFMGTMDGNGHTITGLTLSSQDSGLFQYVGATGLVYDLTVSGANVLFSDNAAVLAHNNHGLIQRCAVENTNITADTGAVLGGMVSRNYGIIRDSYVEGGVLTSNSQTATGHGGFLGSNEEGGLIERCWSSMEVRTQSDYAGGFAGLSYGGTIRDCFSLGDVSARGYSGGFVGRSVYEGSIYENCYAAGTVTVTGQEGHGFIGGNKPDSAFQYDQSEGIVNCWYNSASPADPNVKSGGEKSLAEMAQPRFLTLLNVRGCWVQSEEVNRGLPCLQGVKAPAETAARRIAVTVVTAGYDKTDYTFFRLGKDIQVELDSTGNTRVDDVMDAAQRSGLLSCSYDTTPSYGRYIRTINGRTVDPPDGWMFTIDGALSGVSSSLAAVEDGSVILWFEGTTENHYQPPTLDQLAGGQTEWTGIGTVEELLALANSADSHALSQNYRLTADLSLDGVEFPGIGSPQAPFTGSFDGQGHTISGMARRGTDGVGFFNVIRGAVIKNLTLTQARAEGSTDVGLLAGRAEVFLNVQDMASSQANLMGNCRVEGSVSGLKRAGGLVGWNGGASSSGTGFSIASAVDRCTAEASVTGPVQRAGEAPSKLGGLAGENSGVITRSSASGPVLAPNGTEAGGLAGANGGDIYDSSAWGSVQGLGHVGGFVGASSGTVTRCCSAGGVSGAEYAGGFAGSISAVDTAVSAGVLAITGSSSTGCCGGFAGSLNGTVAGVQNQITVKNSFGNCTQPDGTLLNPVGNTSAFSSEAQREALDRMTLSTRAAAAEKLYDLFGLTMPQSPEMEAELGKYVDAVTVAADTPAGSVLSLLSPGAVPGEGFETDISADSEYLSGGGVLTLVKNNPGAPVTVTVQLAVRRTDGSEGMKKPVQVTLLGSLTPEALMDAIAATLTESPDGWTVLDMARYAALPGKTIATTPEARQAALDRMLEEAAAASYAGDRARLELTLRAIGIDSTRLYPLDGSGPVDNAKALAELDFAAAGHYAAPWILLAGIQGNAALSSAQKEGLKHSLRDNMGDGLFEYEYAGVTYPSPDTTAIAITALTAALPGDPEAEEMTKTMLAALEGAIGADGSYGSANTDAFVIIALISLGRDPADFCAPSGASVVDGLMSYVNPGQNGFTYAGQENALATEQGFRALVALAGFDGSTPYNLYDFSKNSVQPGYASGSAPGPEQPGQPNPPSGAKEITVTLTVRAIGEDWISDERITLKEGSTVCHALSRGLANHGMTAVGMEQGYVKSITKGDTTLAELGHGPDSGWLYTVNGSGPDIPLTAYVLQDGDAIRWYYTSDWTRDPVAGSVGGGGKKEEVLPPEEILVLPAPDAQGNITAQITLPEGVSQAVVRIPAQGLTAGYVPVKLGPDGQEEILQKSFPDGEGMLVLVEESCTVKLEDRTRQFSDTRGHWGEEAITFASARGLFQGTGEDTFSPDRPLTRAMLVTVLYSLEGGSSQETCPFPDVPADAWYAGAVAWASAKGIVSGTGEGFSPQRNITREALAMMLYRCAQTAGLDTEAAGELSRFTDEEDISAWARQALSWAVGSGLLSGKGDGRLDPAGPATRAEAAVMTRNLIGLMVSQNSQT